MSAITVRIPTPLRIFTGGADEIPMEGSNVRDVLLQLVARHGELDKQLFKGDGELRDFINIFLGDTNIRSIAGLDSPIESAEVLNIVPAVAGGRL